jgi:transposase
MKKHTSEAGRGKLRKAASERAKVTVGIDLGDRTSRFAVVDAAGEVIHEGGIATTRKAITQAFATMPSCRIALEVGTHSPWVSRLLTGLGHEVLVANPRQLRAITESSRKNDRLDARMLARLARADPRLLRPIRHRSEHAQAHLMTIRVRSALVEARTAAVNAARGLAKSVGERLPDCDADQMGPTRMEGLTEWVSETIKPLLEQAERLTGEIRNCDREIEQIARNEYPETQLLEQVWGVGTLIALTFVLTVDEPSRFARSRDVGCYVGLRPERSQSGERDPELGITKEGDIYLRKLLVQGAHRILSRAAPDTDLKRWGQKLASRGGKNAKKRAIVAVARKVAILLHRLWVSGEVYEPLRNSQQNDVGKKAA